ncbi:MAG: DNA alkylation repair protein [Anaerovoracaceae bacterium]|jgi:3-methyladenine DNA glycosylase AlkD
MNYNKMFVDMKNNGDSEQAIKMSAYMRNQFTFLGIPTPKRRLLCKEYFKITKSEKQIDWDFINNCWQQPYREFQYVAIDYLALMQKYLTLIDIPKLKELIIAKSWWDTVDGLNKFIGYIALNDPKVNDILFGWSTDENFWLRRVAIIHQLLFKDKTNTELMERIIVNNLGQSEFFINKAIGWSLRQYSKTDADWVREFVEKYRDRLAPLSIKEASKYL